MHLFLMTDSGRLYECGSRGLDLRTDGLFPQIVHVLAGDMGRAILLASDSQEETEAQPVLLAIDTDRLDSTLLLPEQDELSERLDMNSDQRTWDEVSWQESLLICGLCSYAGTIPAEALKIARPGVKPEAWESLGRAPAPEMV